MLAGAMLGVFAFMRRWVGAIAPDIALRRAAGATRGRMVLYLGSRIVAVGLAGAAVGLIFFGPTLWGAVAASVPAAPSWAQARLAWLGVLLLGAAIAGAAFPAWNVLRSAPARFLSDGQ